MKAIEKFKWLLKNEKNIELKVKHPKRSISQNSYLHLIFSWFGIETGYSVEEVKQEIFKKYVNPSLFYEGEVEEIKGIKIERWRSTADLDTSQMTLAIDKFRNFASQELGIYIPEPKDLALLQEIENEISKNNNQQFNN